MNARSERSGRLLDLRAGLPKWFSGTGWFPRVAFTLVERLLGYDRLDRLFRAAHVEDAETTYLHKLSRRFSFHVEIDGASVIPESGPVIVVANHPFGGADSITVGDFIVGQRRDTRILANRFLASVEPLTPWLIGVDVYGGGEAAGRNLGGMRAASRHLATGGCLVVFPAGEVASWQWASARVEEPPWSDHAAALAIRHRAVVIPVFVPGRNSVFFQILGVVHPLLRTAWLGRELLRARGRKIRLRVKAPVAIPEGEERREATRRIREALFG